MTKDILRYDKMVETALRGVVREALLRAAQHGLPGSHHFYVTFRTGHPGVGLPEYLRAQYPHEMTIVLEHQFWELSVADDAFSVTLSFKNRPERLTIPFIAITAFADPSVKFALQFQEAGAGEEGEGKRRLGVTESGVPATLEPPPARPGDTKAPAEKLAEGEKKAGEVVTLDAFRKK